MGANSLANTLQENPWFQALPPPLFQKLRDIASRHIWAEGDLIFREGDAHDFLYLILDGQVALEMYIPGRGKFTIMTLGSADLFGWSAVTPVMGTRTSSARAIQATTAIGFDSQALRAACAADHDLGYHVYRRLTNVIAGRLSATRLQLLDMYGKAGQ